MTTRSAEEILVAVLAEPGLTALSGALAALAAGAAFVPLDPKLPDARLDFMVANAGITIVLADAASLGRAHAIAERAATALRVIAIEQPAADGGRPVEAVGVCQASPDDLAYVIYTSGSSGTPKGVAITHGNLAPLWAWSVDHFGLGPGTKVAQNLSPAFDFGTWEMLTTVCAGGTLYFAGRAGDLAPGAFAQAIVEWRIDTLHTTPAFFAELVFTGRRMGSLRQVHLGGEKLTGALVGQAAAVLNADCRLHNGYGPTEATVNCAINVIDRERVRAEDAVPIGVASAENLLYILSEALEEVPGSEIGELFVGGPGVARGYIGCAGLTAERFLPDPYVGRPGARMYRTGDLVRRWPDGGIGYVGRTDGQVKVRGHRLELGEIEAVLLQCTEIASVVVVARRVSGVREAIQLVGYLVPRASGKHPDEHDKELFRRVRRFAAERLPDYMIPAVFVALPQLPLTPNGKVDRAGLQDLAGSGLIPEPERHPGARTGDAPAVLAEIWAEVLGVPQVRSDDNFFDLGGDSLCAMRIAEAAQSAGIALDPTVILTGQSIETVVKLI